MSFHGVDTNSDQPDESHKIKKRTERANDKKAHESVLMCSPKSLNLWHDIVRSQFFLVVYDPACAREYLKPAISVDRTHSLDIRGRSAAAAIARWHRLRARPGPVSCPEPRYPPSSYPWRRRLKPRGCPHAHNRRIVGLRPELHPAPQFS